MNHRTLTACVAGLALAAAGAGAAVAASGAAAPAKAVVKQKFGVKMKANRYVQDELRFDKDVYDVKSGGTVSLLLTADQEGPHTMSAVKEKDLPKTGAEAFGNCKICNKLGQAHGADPNTNAPPKFNFLEDGVGQNTAPNFDKPGDSVLSGQKKGDKVDFTVTAKKGTTLYFMCIIHPWMQAKLLVK
jgi:plastocyanin